MKYICLNHSIEDNGVIKTQNLLKRYHSFKKY